MLFISFSLCVRSLCVRGLVCYYLWLFVFMMVCFLLLLVLCLRVCCLLYDWFVCLVDWSGFVVLVVLGSCCLGCVCVIVFC